MGLQLEPWPAEVADQFIDIVRSLDYHGFRVGAEQSLRRHLVDLARLLAVPIEPDLHTHFVDYVLRQADINLWHRLETQPQDDEQPSRTSSATPGQVAGPLTEPWQDWINSGQLSPTGAIARNLPRLIRGLVGLGYVQSHRNDRVFAHPARRSFRILITRQMVRFESIRRDGSGRRWQLEQSFRISTQVDTALSWAARALPASSS